MAKAYYENLSDLMVEITPYISTDANLEIKHFFSGAAVFADGHICITLTPVGLAIKLPKELRKGLIERKEANSLRYFPGGPIKKDYVLLSQHLLDDKDSLREWIEKSINHVLASPIN